MFRKSLISFGVITVILMLSLVTAACSERTVQEKSVSLTAVPVLKVEEELEYKELALLVDRARKEGVIIVYSSEGGDIRSALVQAFQGKYNVKVDYLAARGPELVPKIVAQRNAGLFIIDVLIGAGAPGAAVLKPMGAFEPLDSALILPEVKEPKHWYGGKIPWMDSKERTTIAFLLNPSGLLTINANLVKQGEINSYLDFLNPKWKGKILTSDPIAPGSFTAWVGMVADIMGVDYLRQLVEQQPVVIENKRLQVEWLARGKYAIGIAFSYSTVEEFRRAGAPLESIVPVEGTELRPGSGVIRMMNKAPHPNAAKLFINWLLSKEGQTLHSKASGEQSAREDVLTEHIDPKLRRYPNVKYIVSNTEEWLLESREREKLSKEIFGHLVK